MKFSESKGKYADSQMSCFQLACEQMLEEWQYKKSVGADTLEERGLWQE